jgi:multidrug resistance efflux pump
VKKKEIFGKKRKKVVLWSVAAAALLVAAGGAFYFLSQGDGGTLPPEGLGMDIGAMGAAQGVVTAQGVTAIGITQENFEAENLETGLLIEEVYVSSNEEIEKGAKILKFSEASVAKARKELEDILQEAELAYRSGVIEWEQNRITIQYERDMAVLAGEQAPEVYEGEVAGLEAGVEQAQKELDEAKEEIAKYQAAVAGNTYDEDYQVTHYKAIYDENLALLQSKMEEWGVSWAQVTGGTGSGGGGPSGSSDGRVSVLSSLYKVLEQNLQDYEQAQSDYEEAKANTEFELQTLELQLSSLERALAEAKEKQQTQILAAKLTYETALANAAHADSDCQTALEKAESDYLALQTALEDAQENLAYLESSAGDGYYYASSAGTVLRAFVRAGQYLTLDQTIFAYSNPEELSVTVSVDQSQIAKLRIGDDAYVQTTQLGSFSGTVTEINPVSGTGSRTNVSYNVTVTLSGDTRQLTANQTVTVVFGGSNLREGRNNE